jgi:hypothetical protein
VLVNPACLSGPVPARCALGSKLRVDREPRGAGAHRGSPQPEPLPRGHGRLSPRTLWGALGRQGLGASPHRLQRLDPDGWLVRSPTDTSPNDRPAAQREPTHEPVTRLNPIRWLHSLRPDEVCPLDTGLPMGGTHYLARGCLESGRGDANVLVRVPRRVTICWATQAGKRKRTDKAFSNRHEALDAVLYWPSRKHRNGRSS